MSQDVDLIAMVTESLRTVIDPEIGYNIVDIGLIYAVRTGSSGAVFIDMTTTTRGCPATQYLQDGARAATLFVDGVTYVEVNLTYMPPWSIAMLSEDARRHLGR